MRIPGPVARFADARTAHFGQTPQDFRRSMNRTTRPHPIRIVAFGAGNRTNKYLEYAVRHPERLQVAGVAELNALRREAVAQRFGLTDEQCFPDYDRFFEHPVEADAVLIATPEDRHFEPCMRAIEAGYHVLLEKPIAQSLDQCRRIAEAARRRGVVVGVCHVLRYHPYFLRIKELVDSGALGEIVSVSHLTAVGLDRATHGFVRGPWRRAQLANPMLVSKCCHDIDFLLWITGSRCRRLASFGSLRWFRREHAPEGSTERCIDCPLAGSCPYSAVDLYQVRREWIANFDIPAGATLDEVIDRELREGDYGRCVFRCDNDVVDHQSLTMEMDNGVTISFTMDDFTLEGRRETHLRMTHGEIIGNEHTLRAIDFRTRREQTWDFAETLEAPYHAGADLRLIEEFVEALSGPGHALRTSIEASVESHRICFEAERSRLTGQTILLD